MYVTKMTNDLAVQIVTGIMDGSPISTQQRRFLLYQTWAGYAVALVGLGIFLAAAQTQLAGSVADESVKTLGWLAAIVAALGSVNWLLNGAAEFLYYRSVVREAEAD